MKFTIDIFNNCVRALCTYYSRTMHFKSPSYAPVRCHVILLLTANLHMMRWGEHMRLYSSEDTDSYTVYMYTTVCASWKFESPGVRTKLEVQLGAMLCYMKCGGNFFIMILLCYAQWQFLSKMQTFLVTIFWPKSATEAISEHPISKNFPGVACPQTFLADVCFYIQQLFPPLLNVFRHLCLWIQLLHRWKKLSKMYRLTSYNFYLLLTPIGTWSIFVHATCISCHNPFWRYVLR